MPYSKKVIETFKNLHNYGKIKNPDGSGKVGNFMCGDLMWLYIKVGRNKKGEEILKDVRFATFGCVADLASSSIITDMAKGKTIKQALQLTKEDVLKILGGLPPIKIHCSVLAIDALSEAIYDYLSRNKKPISDQLKQRHKILEKERKMIEEKYKGWIRQEEQLHQND